MSPPPALTINRCLCEKKRFADVVPGARAAGWSLLELMRQTGCGTHCGLCRPYLRRALKTGEIEFHELLTGD